MTSTTSVTAVDPADFVWTASSGPAAQVRRLVEAATAADGRSPLNEASLLSLRRHGLAGAHLFLADLSGPGVAPATQGPDKSGFALVDGTAEGSELNLVVDPARRDHGVGSALLSTALREAGPEDGHVSAWSHGNHPAAAALAARAGFARVRDLWLMRRPLDEDLPPLREVDHVDVRPFRPGADEEAFLRLNAEAFAHHPEQGSMTRVDLDDRIAEPWFDPAGFFLATREGALLGFHWTKVHTEVDPPVGEVYVVGVAPDAQGSGLGRTLTLAGLHHLRSRGLSEVILYVEADNAPAVALYERLGFTHAEEDTDVQYVRPGAPT